MDRTNGIVCMTREQFKQYCSEAIDKIMKIADEGSPMTGFFIGTTSMTAFGKLEDVIFGEEEPETDRDTKTSIF